MIHFYVNIGVEHTNEKKHFKFNVNICVEYTNKNMVQSYFNLLIWTKAISYTWIDKQYLIH